MGIPIGKLALYTAGSGVHPRRCLPVMLDVGTNNEALLADPLYVGTRRKRLAGAEFDELVEEFIEATQVVFPGVLVQFEDFANHNAFRLLKRYRDRICSFNDDIQGTASVTVAGIFSALRVTKKKMSEQTFLCLGAGEAATGISDLLVAAMQADGLSGEATRAAAAGWSTPRGWSWPSARTSPSTRNRMPIAHAPVGDFLGAVKALKPTAIIGVGATPNTFTREVIETMTQLNERPDRLRAVESDLARRVHGRAGLPVVRRQGAVCLRQSRSIRSTSTASATCRARATTPTSSRASAWAPLPSVRRA